MLEWKELQVGCLSLVPGAVFSAFKTACCHRSTKAGFCSQRNGLDKTVLFPAGQQLAADHEGQQAPRQGAKGGPLWVPGERAACRVREDRHHAERVGIVYLVGYRSEGEKGGGEGKGQREEGRERRRGRSHFFQRETGQRETAGWKWKEDPLS